MAIGIPGQKIPGTLRVGMPPANRTRSRGSQRTPSKGLFSPALLSSDLKPAAIPLNLIPQLCDEGTGVSQGLYSLGVWKNNLGIFLKSHSLGLSPLEILSQWTWSTSPYL